MTSVSIPHSWFSVRLQRLEKFLSPGPDFPSDQIRDQEIEDGKMLWGLQRDAIISFDRNALK